jgi:hypothetical protein
MKKCIVFSPYSEIWAHSYPEARVIEGLIAEGWEVLTVRCNGFMRQYCTAMSANKLTFDTANRQKKNICTRCKKKRNLLDTNFSMESVNIEDFLLETDYELVEQYFGLRNIKSLHDLKFLGVEVGKLAVYEYMIENKYSFNDEKILRDLKFQHEVKKCLYTLLAAERIKNYFTPDYLIVYNSLYATNRAICALYENHDIRSYSMHAGSFLKSKYSQIQLYRWDKDPQLVHKTNDWLVKKEKSLNSAQVNLVEIQIINQIKAKNMFTYSTPHSEKSKTEIKNYFNMNNNPTAVAILSSEDEYNAAIKVGLFPSKIPNNITFQDTFDWLSNIISFFKAKSCFNLIIRVHPREMPNKRESVISPNIKKLKDLFGELPNNIVVNWPDDNISIYEIFTISSLILNQNSSAGLEANALGINTLVHDPKYLVPYDPEIGYTAKNKQDYFDKIESLIYEKENYHTSVKAYRYIYYSSINSSLNIEEATFYHSNPIEENYNKLINLILRCMKLIYVKRNFIIYEKYLMKKNRNKSIAIHEVIDTLNHNHSYIVENCLKQNEYTSNNKEAEILLIQNSVKAIRDMINYG